MSRLGAPGTRGAAMIRPPRASGAVGSSRPPVLCPAAASAEAVALCPAAACKPNRPPRGEAQPTPGGLARGFVGVLRRDEGAFRPVVPACDDPVRSVTSADQPNLLNNPKGLSMAKTALVSLQVARKSVPVAESAKGGQIVQSSACRTVIERAYTLCEVDKGNRQFVPPPDRPVFVPEDLPGSGSICCPICSARFRVPVTHGISAKNDTNPGFCKPPKPAPALGWHGITARCWDNYAIAKVGLAIHAAFRPQHASPGLECVQGGAA